MLTPSSASTAVPVNKANHRIVLLPYAPLSPFFDSPNTSTGRFEFRRHPLAASKEMWLLAFLQTVSYHLRVAFGANAPPPPLLPLPMDMPQGQRRRRELAFCRCLVDLARIFVVCCAYFMAFAAAQRLSVAFAPFTLVAVMQIVYLGVYALEYSGVIDGERCDSLIESVEKLCLVGNFFAPTPPAIRPWPMQGLALLARSVARRLGALPDDEEV